AHISTPNQTDWSKPLPIAFGLNGGFPSLVGLENESQCLTEGGRKSQTNHRAAQLPRDRTDDVMHPDMRRN
ncbi:MAG: hypothetical protein WCA52_01080, partial [Candidatus Aquilonibacter sp.]